MSIPGTTVASWMISSGCQLRVSTPMTLAHQSEKDVGHERVRGGVRGLAAGVGPLRVLAAGVLRRVLPGRVLRAAGGYCPGGVLVAGVLARRVLVAGVLVAGVLIARVLPGYWPGSGDGPPWGGPPASGRGGSPLPGYGGDVDMPPDRRGHSPCGNHPRPVVTGS